MAAALYQPKSIISKPVLGQVLVVEQLVIEDLIEEIAPDMQFTDSRTFQNIQTVLRGSLNSVAVACQDMASLSAVISAERRRVAPAGKICLSAFDLFVRNLDIGD